MMGNYGYGTGSMMNGGGFWMWALVCAGVIFLLLIVVGLILLFASMTRRKNMPAAPTETPLEILDRRYASGEIDKKEYDQRKKDLR